LVGPARDDDKLTESAWCVLSAMAMAMDGPTAQSTCELRYAVEAVNVQGRSREIHPRLCLGPLWRKAARSLGSCRSFFLATYVFPWHPERHLGLDFCTFLCAGTIAACADDQGSAVAARTSKPIRSECRTGRGSFLCWRLHHLPFCPLTENKNRNNGLAIIVDY
jgi:hypothetical protein